MTALKTHRWQLGLTTAKENKMRKRIGALVLMWVGLLLAANAVLACWADVPLEEIVQGSPVVVVGKIVKIDVAAPADRATDTAHIQVARVLKNKLDTPI